MLKALIFDFDGTLADTFGAIHEAIDLALDALSLPRISAARLMEFFNGSAAAYAREMLPAGLRNDAALVARANELLMETYGKTYTHTDRTYAGVGEAVAALKPHFRLGMLSNKPEEFLLDLDRRLFSAGTFEIVHGVRAEYPPKPDPAVALAMAAEWGVLPAECAFIGDSEVDLLTARNAGMHAVSVCWGYRDEAFLRAHGVTMLARTPTELENILKHGDF